MKSKKALLTFHPTHVNFLMRNKAQSPQISTGAIFSRTTNRRVCQKGGGAYVESVSLNGSCSFRTTVPMDLYNTLDT